MGTPALILDAASSAASGLPPGSLDAFAVSAAVAWVIPALVDLVVKAHAPTSLKTAIATTLSALAGILPTVTLAPHEGWAGYVVAVGIALANTQAAHRVLKGVGDPVQKATGERGLGSAPKPKPRKRATPVKRAARPPAS